MAKLAELQQRIIYTLRQLEWPAQIGLALLVITFLLGFWLISAWAKQQDLLAETTRLPVQTKPQKMSTPALDLAQQFYLLLPKAKDADSLSASILHTADGLGLRFERAEFSATQLAEARLIQHQIKLPVQGTYMQIRQFLNALLNSHPTLALQEFQVHREDVLSDTVQANLVLTLYLRGEAPW